VRSHRARRPIAVGMLAMLCAAWSGAGTAVAAPATAKYPIVKLPAGFALSKVVGGLTFPTSLTWDNRGRMYVAQAGGEFLPEPQPAQILRITPGRAQPVLNLTKTGVADAVVGLQWYKGAFYFSHRDPRDFSGAISKVTPAGKRTQLFTGFRDSQAEHQINDVRLGPDGRMYFVNGPAANSAVVGPDNAAFVRLNRGVHTRSCRDIVLNGYNFGSANFLTARPADKALTGAYVPYGTVTYPGTRIAGDPKCGGAIFSFDPDQSRPTLHRVAYGMRNVIGVAWDRRGTMYAAVNGYDVRGSRPIQDQYDATYRVRPGTWYGVPDYSAALQPVTLPKFDVPDALQAPVYRGRQLLPTRDLRFLINHRASGLQPPDRSLVYGLHKGDSSPSELDVAPTSWGAYGNAVFVAEFGDLAPGTNPLLNGHAGFQVSRIDRSTGKAVPFLRNIKPAPASELGALGRGIERPFDVQFGPDGAMYVVDFGQVVVNPALAPPPYEYPTGTGAIWKVTRTGGSGSTTAAAPAGTGTGAGPTPAGLIPAGLFTGLSVGLLLLVGRGRRLRRPVTA